MTGHHLCCVKVSITQTHTHQSRLRIFLKENSLRKGTVQFEMARLVFGQIKYRLACLTCIEWTKYILNNKLWPRRAQHLCSALRQAHTHDIRNSVLSLLWVCMRVSSGLSDSVVLISRVVSISCLACSLNVSGDFLFLVRNIFREQWDMRWCSIMWLFF